MRTNLTLVIVLVIDALEVATMFVIFVPVVPETFRDGCLSPCQYVYVVNYYGSISYHYFNVGVTYGACDGFQMSPSANQSPLFCMKATKGVA